MMTITDSEETTEVLQFNKKDTLLANVSFLLAGETGLEPATPGFGDRCSTN